MCNGQHMKYGGIRIAPMWRTSYESLATDQTTAKRSRFGVLFCLAFFWYGLCVRLAVRECSPPPSVIIDMTSAKIRRPRVSTDNDNDNVDVVAVDVAVRLHIHTRTPLWFSLRVLFRAKIVERTFFDKLAHIVSVRRLRSDQDKNICRR